ncbi:hypothetical protein FAGKG844_210069 [Frankia sp. AgKG'84/4]
MAFTARSVLSRGVPKAKEDVAGVRSIR